MKDMLLSGCYMSSAYQRARGATKRACKEIEEKNYWSRFALHMQIRLQGSGPIKPRNEASRDTLAPTKDDSKGKSKSKVAAKRLSDNESREATRGLRKRNWDCRCSKVCSIHLGCSQ
jgi:hypothetical protein